MELSNHRIKKLMKHRGTYYILRFLVSKRLRKYAYYLYIYFRWVDDYIDYSNDNVQKKRSFLDYQKKVLTDLYSAKKVMLGNIYERLVNEVIDFDLRNGGGLRGIILLMFSIFYFDLRRYKRFPDKKEFLEYSERIAIASQRGMRYFLQDKNLDKDVDISTALGSHYLHLVRDFVIDLKYGYYNISGQEKEEYNVDIEKVNDENFRRWVKHRVKIVENMFRKSSVVSRNVNIKCRLMQKLYLLRYKRVISKIKRDNYFIK